MEFPQRVVALRKKLGITQGEMAKRLGVGNNWISQLELNKRQPSDAVARHVELLERAVNAGMFEPMKYPIHGSGSMLRDEPADAPLRGEFAMVPVIGWAHAGEAASYEEIPVSWQERVPTQCRDPHAFGVTLEGESMEPKYSAGDLLILQPGKEPFSGCLAVCRFGGDEGGGVMFRRVEFLPDEIRLIALNPSYPTTTHPRESFSWIYPVWGRWTQVWK